MMTLPKKLTALFLAIAFAFGISACSDQSQMEGAAEQATEEAAAEGESTATE